MQNKKINFISKRIKSRKSNITVIGLGYAGLPLCVLLKSKFKVFGIDNDLKRVADLKKGNAHINNKNLRSLLLKTKIYTYK